MNLRVLLSISGALLLGVLYYKLTWFGLPLRRTPGHLDSLFVCLSLSALVLLMSFLPRWLALTLSLPGLAFAATLVVADWWHVEFYRDIIVPSSFRYGMDLMESSHSIGKLGPVLPGIAGIIAMLALGTLVLWQRPGARQAKTTLASAALLLALAANYYYEGYTRFPERIPVGGMHPLAGFLREAWKEGSDQPEPKHTDALAVFRPTLKQHQVSAQFPLLRAKADSSTQSQAKLNVLVVVLESVRASETGFWGGVPITPNLDELARTSYVGTEFYANSTQTIRGEMAILCSLLDYNRGAPFSESGARLRQHCLPDILAQHGYSTHWIHGFRRNFFKRDIFMPQAGFQHIHDQAVITVTQPNLVKMGWGLRDEDTMDYAIRTLEKQQGPFFAEVMTLSNHHPFEWEWERAGIDLSQFDGQGELANYHKGIHYTDFALGQLVKKLNASKLANNTVLIVVGDHGVWHFDKEKDHSNLFVLNEKYFRLPFILHMPGQTEQKRLDFTASQIDIPPTLLDLLQIQHDTAFLGQSLLSEPEDQRFAIMEKIGGAGFRRGNVACYPVSESCTGAYAMCNSNASFSYVCGHAALADAGYGQPFPVDSGIKDLTKAATLVSEYMNRGHLFGFVPDLSRLSEEKPVTVPALISAAKADSEHLD